MQSKPSYLDFQDQYYYPVTLHKELIFDSEEEHFHLELFESIVYDSYDRVIDLTDSITHVLRKAYGPQQESQIYVYDPFVLDFRFLTYFPTENSITLGEQFLQADTLLFRIKRIQELEASDEEELQIAGIDCYDQPEEQELNQGAGPEQKTKRRKTIREMLEVVKQWRKLCIQHSSKLSVNEGAEMIGISKRTLQFYLHSAKLAEKYSYPFEANLDCRISDLKKFLREKSQQKKTQQMQMLAKLKNFYK